MQQRCSRRAFLARTWVAAAACSLVPRTFCAAAASASGLGFPLEDFHVHLDNSTIEKVVELSKERGVKFGIVEHAGTKENKYPVVLSNDAELKGYLKMLDGQPVFKGVQTEWKDWMGCFSHEALAQLDYVLTDTMTFPGKDGQRVKLWEPGVEDRVDMADKQQWMDRYVDWHIEIMARQPIDILANTSWLPAPLADSYETYWTPERMNKVMDAAVRYRVAFEISSSFKLPKPSFVKAARAAGIKFSLGSNGRYPNMGKLDFSIAMAKELGLRRDDLFTPAPDGQKAAQRRKY
jgi:histidinol phosphatase-like PHP family hydrolase